MASLSDLNDRLFLAINDVAKETAWLHGAAQVFAKYGVVLFALAILIAYLHARHDAPRVLAASVWTGLGTVIAVGINQPIGNTIGEMRPYGRHPDALLLVSRTTDFSFPSDHAVMAGAVAMGLVLVSRKWGLVAGAGAVLMAVTRVYVGAHYPGDVIAGLVVGGLISLLGWLLVGTALTRLVVVLGETRFAPLIRSAGNARNT